MKTLSIVIFILLLANIAQFFIGHNLSLENQAQKETISNKTAIIETLTQNNQAKNDALIERENDKQKEKEHLNNEFKKLKENQSPDYRTWADTPLPSNVFDIMRGKYQN